MSRGGKGRGDSRTKAHLINGLSRDGVQLCSGLVDLVVCVGRHRGGGHRLALAGERFVGLVTEDFAQVGDRGGDLGDRRCGEGTEGEAGDGGRRFVASEPVEKCSEVASGTRIVAVLPDSWKLRMATVKQSSAASGSPYLASRRAQNARQPRLVPAVAAVLCDHQAPA